MKDEDNDSEEWPLPHGRGSENKGRVDLRMNHELRASCFIPHPSSFPVAIVSRQRLGEQAESVRAANDEKRE
jgi:hypothetical protein